MPGNRPVRAAEIGRLMEEQNRSVKWLHEAINRCMTERAIRNILNGATKTVREDNLARIATALGVKMMTLVEGYKGEPEPLDADGGVIVKTAQTTTVLTLEFDEGIAEEELLERIKQKLRGRVMNVDDIRIAISRRQGNADQA